MRCLAAACLVLLVTACAGLQQSGDLNGSPLSRSAEITATPFFPQQDYQCGPASLAMALGFAGREVSPEALVPLVYLPAREGSLQAEMLVAPARYALLGVRITPTLPALLQLLDAGYPVIVLQNLGLETLPAWHYAVAYGYSLDRNQIYLRSGTDPDARVNLRRFAKTWSRADHWAMVVVEPGEVPPSVSPEDYLAGVAVLERLQDYRNARQGYLAAGRHWPDNALAWAGAGNSAYALGDFAAAEQAYRQALRRDGENPLLMNNLAMALGQRGCQREALAVLDCARARYPRQQVLTASNAEIRQLPANGAGCEPFVCPFSGR